MGGERAVNENEIMVNTSCIFNILFRASLVTVRDEPKGEHVGGGV